MKYPESNLLVIRRVFNTLRNSCRADLIWAINRLKVNHLWKIPKGEHTLTYLPTGQQILFAGLDDPLKLTSITVAGVPQTIEQVLINTPQKRDLRGDEKRSEVNPRDSRQIRSHRVRSLVLGGDGTFLSVARQLAPYFQSG